MALEVGGRVGFQGEGCSRLCATPVRAEGSPCEDGAGGRGGGRQPGKDSGLCPRGVCGKQCLKSVSGCDVIKSSRLHSESRWKRGAGEQEGASAWEGSVDSAVRSRQQAPRGEDDGSGQGVLVMGGGGEGEGRWRERRGNSWEENSFELPCPGVCG